MNFLFSVFPEEEMNLDEPEISSQAQITSPKLSPGISSSCNSNSSQVAETAKEKGLPEPEDLVSHGSGETEVSSTGSPWNFQRLDSALTVSYQKMYNNSSVVIGRLPRIGPSF